jgi:hypothetical protein
MTKFFKFEADFVDSLRCIPMSVRLKLDTCGIKLKLAEWNHFTKQECDRLVELPCVEIGEIDAYREYLRQLILQQTGLEPTMLAVDARPPWLNDREIPVSVKERMRALSVDLELSQWQQLTSLQKFALIKLIRSQHENNNFLPALKEFGLLV